MSTAVTSKMAVKTTIGGSVFSRAAQATGAQFPPTLPSKLGIVGRPVGKVGKNMGNMSGNMSGVG